MKTSLRLYKCGLCSKEKELLIRQSSPDLLNCIMTPDCQGHLSLLRTRRGSRPQQSSLSSLDKPKRGANTAVQASTPTAKRLSIQAGQHSLALALYKQTQVSPSVVEFSVPYIDGGDVVVDSASFGAYRPSSSAVIELIELVNDELLLRKYSFAKQASRYVLEGEDDSPLRRTLRIGVNEQVKVIVNGVELPSESYVKQLNKLVLTPAIADSLIDVYVYRDVASSAGKLIKLTFECPSITDNVDLEHRRLSSWGRSVATDSDLGTLITAFSFGVSLERAKTYLFKRAYAFTSDDVQVPLDLNRVALLVGVAPYAFEDKRIDQYVKLADLALERISLQAFDDSSVALCIGENAFTDSITLVRESRRIAALEADESSLAVSLLNKPAAKYTIGPV